MTGTVGGASPTRQGSPTPADPVLSPPTARVIDVIEAVAAAPGRHWSVAELARTTGLTRGTAHALLSTLAARGWLRRDAEKSYSVGPYLGVLGRSLAQARPLETRAHDVAAKLAAETGHRTVVVHLLGDALVVTDLAAPPGVRDRLPIGTRIPFAPPFGPGFVAWADPATTERWLADAAAVNPDLANRLALVLDAVRDRGFSLERLDDASAATFEVLGRLQDDVFGDAVRAVLGQLLVRTEHVDYLPDELAALPPDALQQVTSIAAPVLHQDASVAFNLALQPSTALPISELLDLGRHLARAAAEIASTVDPPQGVTR